MRLVLTCTRCSQMRNCYFGCRGGAGRLRGLDGGDAVNGGMGCGRGCGFIVIDRFLVLVLRGIGR